MFLPVLFLYFVENWLCLGLGVGLRDLKYIYKMVKM